MRTLFLTSAATALMAANTDQGAAETPTSTDAAQAGDAEIEGDADTTEAFTFETVTNENIKEVAEAVFARIKGEKYSDRVDTVNAFIGALREARDEGRTKRVKRDPKDVVADAIGKPMSELQAVKFNLAGIPLSLPQIMNIVESEKSSPMKPAAKKFVEEHKLVTVAEKVKSRGKDTKFLRREGYVAPVKPEKTEGEQKAA